MSGNAVFNPASAFTGKAELVVVRYAAELNAQPLIAPPSTWFKGLVMERSGGAIVERFYIPVHSFGDGDEDGDGDNFTGKMRFSGTSEVFFDVRRKVKQAGVMESAQKIAEMDFGAFDKTPASLAKWAGKLDQKAYARLWNNGYTTPDWTGTNYWRKTAVKPYCPGRPGIGKFLNAYENAALNVANIKIAMTNVRGRKGFDGMQLDLEPLYLYVSNANYQTAKDICVLGNLIGGVGPDGTTNVGGVTNTLIGSLMPVKVPGLRDDLWIVGAEPQDEWMRPFARNAGGPIGQYTANTDPNKPGSGVPYIQTIVYGPEDRYYKEELKLGLSHLVNVGWGLGTPHCYCANFTGSAS
jgi:hypothetical protein